MNMTLWVMISMNHVIRICMTTHTHGDLPWDCNYTLIMMHVGMGWEHVSCVGTHVGFAHVCILRACIMNRTSWMRFYRVFIGVDRLYAMDVIACRINRSENYRTWLVRKDTFSIWSFVDHGHSPGWVWWMIWGACFVLALRLILLRLLVRDMSIPGGRLVHPLPHVF